MPAETSTHGPGSEITMVLASASPARLDTLRRAGIEPIVRVSSVDESAVTEPVPARLAAVLARLKAEDVAATLVERPPVAGRWLVLGCDSVLDVDGAPHGKPESASAAAARLRQLRGRSAVLHTGHHLMDPVQGRVATGTASTTVVFGELSDEEIEAYVATGEPLQVAGSFTIDGLGGAFVERVDGDPHNVVGLSLPLMRRMAGELGVSWPQLWARRR